MKAGRIKNKSIKIKVAILSFVLLLCIINIFFLLWHRPAPPVPGRPKPFLLVPTTEGFANNLLNVNDAWFQFTKSRHRDVSILRTKVPHYENIDFCVGDYIILPPGVSCSKLLADNALQGGLLRDGAPVMCDFPRVFYRDILWFVESAESWLGAAAQFMHSENDTVATLKGVRVTEGATWDYQHVACGLYRFTDYKFSHSKTFPVIFQPRVMEQYDMLRQLLVEMNDLFLDPSTFTVVHWRRGDEISRYYEGTTLPLNCRPVEDFEAGLRQLLASPSLGGSAVTTLSSPGSDDQHAVYISTNEQNSTSLSYLEDRGYVTLRALFASPGYRALDHYHPLDSPEEFLFEINMMAAAGRFVFFGNSKVPILVERVLNERKLAFKFSSTTMESSSSSGVGGGDTASRQSDDAFKASAYIKKDFLHPR